jgi:hypothetical protein
MSAMLAEPAKCIGELAAHEELEVMIVQPADGVTWASDCLNPPAPAPEA